MPDRFAILLDGGFVKKRLKAATHRDPSASDIVALSRRLVQAPGLRGLELLRTYYYDALPFDEVRKNPLANEPTNFGVTRQAHAGRILLESLELEPGFAVRHGSLMMSGWKLGRAAMREHSKRPRSLVESDLVPDLTQKGVDLRIGLDIAVMSLKRLVQALVLVTGDSDLVPAMKFARREGVRVHLDVLGHAVRRELRVHADEVL